MKLDAVTVAQEGFKSYMKGKSVTMDNRNPGVRIQNKVFVFGSIKKY